MNYKMFVKRTLRLGGLGYYLIVTSNEIKKKAIRNIIGKRVREARRRQAFTQDQLSGKLATEGIILDRVSITKIESGLRCVFDFEVRAFAAVLKVELQWLLGADGQTLKDDGLKPLGSRKARK